MNKLFGTMLSFVLILSIVGAPRPLIGIGDAVNYGVETTSRSISTNYPTEPPDPMEWFLPKYPNFRSVPIISLQAPLQTIVSNQVPNQSESVPELIPNAINSVEIKQGLDQEREEKLARMKEGLEKMSKDIQEAVEKAKRYN